MRVSAQMRLDLRSAHQSVTPLRGITMPTLFDPLKLGDLTLPNRIIMAPLTRLRAGETHIPNELMIEYYRQRSTAGLVISEGVPVSEQAIGYQGVPGIWSEEQAAGWKAMTQVVKRAGGRIFMQSWHAGRISDPIFHQGRSPVSPSPIAANGHVSLLRPERPFVAPRALTELEVEDVVESFRRAAEFAQAAGFDGVELHGANGYLLDQFLQDGSSQRTDRYGGPIENRGRRRPTPQSRCGARIGLACIWRPEPIFIQWATRIAWRPLAMSRANSVAGALHLSARGSEWRRTVSARCSKPFSRVPISPMRASRRSRLRQLSMQAGPTRSLSARRLSQTRICPPAFD